MGASIGVPIALALVFMLFRRYCNKHRKATEEEVELPPLPFGALSPQQVRKLFKAKGSIRVPSGPIGGQPHTVSALVRFPTGGYGGPWPDAQRQWLLNLGQAGGGAHHWLWSGGTHIQFGVWCGEQVDRLPQAALDGNEHALVMTFYGATLRMYVDGELHAQKGAKFNIQTTDVAAGTAKLLGEANFRGTIRAVHVQHGALSPQQVRELFKAASLGTSLEKAVAAAAVLCTIS